MLGIISVIIGLVGFGWAGWKDLRTTEFPDWVPYSMIFAALILRGVFSFLEGNYMLLLNSAIVGCVLLGFGLLLYHFRQWGDGDAWLLGALGFLFPDGLGFDAAAFSGGNLALFANFPVSPFPLLMVFNFFFVAFFYIVVYSVVVGLRSREAGKFFRDFRKDLIRIVGITVVFTLGIFGVFYYAGMPAQVFSFVVLFPPLLFLLLVFLHYGRFIEGNVFKKRISVKELREGDVPVGEKWRVLGRKEIRALQKKGGKIWIKEGVRFSPVFFLTILVMLLYGNLWNLIVQVI